MIDFKDKTIDEIDAIQEGLIEAVGGEIHNVPRETEAIASIFMDGIGLLFGELRKTNILLEEVRASFVKFVGTA